MDSAVLDVVTDDRAITDLTADVARVGDGRGDGLVHVPGDPARVVARPRLRSVHHGRGTRGVPMADVAATGPGLVEAHAQGLEHTRGYVAGTAPEAWSSSTPCEQWDARQLLNHITTGNLWVAELTAGRTIDEVGDRLDGDQVGTDPVLGYEVSSRAADAAWRRAGALTEAVAVSYGPVPGELYLGHRCIDVLVHGWDLAAATGQDRTLPASLLEVLWEVIEPQLDMVVGSGAFGSDHETEDDDDLQSRVLHLLGRDPAWSGPA